MSGLVNYGMDKGSMMESEDRIEKTVDIYISAEAVRNMKHKKDMEETQTPQHTESDSVRMRSSRAVLVCLVLLCVLLTAVIVLCVHIHTKSTNYTERDQLLTKITNLTEERDQLITNNTNLTEERDQLLTKITNLTEERDQLITNNTNLTEERDQLITNNTNLTEERDQLITNNTNLTEERDQLITNNTNLTEERDQLITNNTNLTEERDQLITNNTNLTEERDQLITNNTNLTEERDQLITNNTNLTEERDQLITNNTNLTEERDQLITNNTNLTEERDQLITNNTNLTEERDQLKSDKNKLICFGKEDGWTKYQYSVYFISSETKSWTESRKYCTDRGADLIIINNRAEQNFVKNITSSADLVWIGLTDHVVEGTWKWVDGTSINSGFWRSGGPNRNRNKNCALTHSPGWADYPCDYNCKWICEKTIFK